MNDHQLLRYSRHILLDEIGIDRQQRLLDAHALIIGAGGLGSPVALYLASAGIGKITIVDADVVDLTNLQRQVMHTTRRIGQSKALSAKIALADINPTIEVNALVERVDKTRLAALLTGVSVVLDCSDNFSTRHAINQACVTANVPLVSGAAIRFDGQISVFDPRDPRSGCYACLFAPDVEFEEERCAIMGVFGKSSRNWASCRYSGRKSCPHSLMQWASSTAIRLGFHFCRSLRNPESMSRSGAA